MWIVKLALDRPYTFVVVALLIFLLSPIVILVHAGRHLPEHQHPGRQHHLELHRLFAAGDGAAHRQHTERALTTTVNDIEHIESHSLNGIAVVKVYFHP